MGLCDASHVDSGDKYVQNLQELVKYTVISYMNDKHEYTSTIENYGHLFITKLVKGNPTYIFIGLLFTSPYSIQYILCHYL